MSGGVDSAVAAARAVDAGHDVVGVHLALSQTRRAAHRVARLLLAEDAGDARRAADVLGIPFYVWDFAARFTRGRRRRLRGGVRARARPPTRACGATRRSSSRRCWTGRWRWGSTPCAPGTTRGWAGVAAPGRRRGQGPVVRAGRAHAGAAAARDVPAGRHAQAGGARRGRRARAAGGRQAGQPRHLLHPLRRHPRLPARAARGAPGRRRRRRVGRGAGPATTACTGSPSASARGSGSAARARTAGRATCSASSR